MEIDLSSLYSNTVEEIDISGDYSLPKEYYEDSDIIRIEKLHVEGKIHEDDHITAKIEGILILPDSISLEEVEYPFLSEYDDKIEENCKKGENILDIFQFLWENILLEVPLQFTRVDDLSKFHGDGWKLISEDELKEQNNPFRDLLKDYDKE
jgi:uncharacterized metal-binding protein YceD (DUF177 family)